MYVTSMGWILSIIEIDLHLLIEHLLVVTLGSINHVQNSNEVKLDENLTKFYMSHIKDVTKKEF